MKSHVLSVGQCSADDARIARVLAVEADAHLDRAFSMEEARQKLAARPYDLVLVNRMFENGQAGLELISEIDGMENGPPAMLVSDYPDAQAAAVAAGALPGFGKSALSSPEVAQLLRQTLHSATRAGQRA